MRLWMTAAAATIFTLVSWSAAGQEVCGKRSDMVAQLEARYGERRVAFALTSGGWVLEIFATKNGRTWTMLTTNPLGKTCLKGAGEGWQLDRVKPQGTTS